MATEKGKSLSKNLLYTPLKACLQHDATATTTTADKEVPKAIHESSLAAFLHSVSQDYHRNHATAHDARNNGSRPLSLDDVENRVRQRAVTLLGGGINASLPRSHQKATSKKKRKRAFFQQTACKKSQRGESLSEIAFLRKLNQKWNAYMFDILGVDMNVLSGDISDTERIQNQVAEKVKNVGRFERVGAHVRVASCQSHKAWVGRCGVVLSETSQAYRIAWIPLPGKESKGKRVEQRRAESNKEISESTSAAVLTFVIPKQGTRIQFLLSLPSFESSSSESRESIDFATSSNEVLIPLSNKIIILTSKEGS